MSLSSGMHRKLLAFYGKGENVILLKFWETAAIYKAAVFEYNSRNKQCKLRKDHSNDS